MKNSRSDFVDAHGVRLHVRRWGSPDALMLFMLHGWMDVAASFQFVVDALEGDWQVLAPDARGFGLSDWPVAQRGGGHYYFQDYLTDLDALIDHYSPAAPVDLIGHSMGANVALLYAGVRPERVRRVVHLEGFGMPESRASHMPTRIARWLDDQRTRPELRPYATLDAVADRLIRTNPRLAPERAKWLATHWSRREADGQFHLLADPAHKLRGPLLYRLDEMQAAWRRVQAKVLHVEAKDSPTLAALAGEVPIAEFKARYDAVPDWREECIDHAGHMIHHDQPARVAALIEAFCACAA
jgi:pimeloyl-ACP methyl ester carboxylesterase